MTKSRKVSRFWCNRLCYPAVCGANRRRQIKNITVISRFIVLIIVFILFPSRVPTTMSERRSVHASKRVLVPELFRRARLRARRGRVRHRDARVRRSIVPLRQHGGMVLLCVQPRLSERDYVPHDNYHRHRRHSGWTKRVRIHLVSSIGHNVPRYMSIQIVSCMRCPKNVPEMAVMNSVFYTHRVITRFNRNSKNNTTYPSIWHLHLRVLAHYDVSNRNSKTLHRRSMRALLTRGCLG